MTDMTFGFDEGGSDALVWPVRSGPDGAIAGRRGARRGQKSLPRVAPDWVDRLGRYLRGEHPQKTAEAVAARCRDQVSVEAVRKWLNRGSAPGGAALLWLATAYGPSLLIACFGPCPLTGAAAPSWLDTAMQAQRADELGARLVAMRAELDAQIAKVRA